MLIFLKNNILGYLKKTPKLKKQMLILKILYQIKMN